MVSEINDNFKQNRKKKSLETCRLKSLDPDVIKCFRNCLHLVLIPFIRWIKKLMHLNIENMTSIKQRFLLNVTLKMHFVRD